MRPGGNGPDERAADCDRAHEAFQDERKNFGQPSRRLVSWLPRVLGKIEDEEGHIDEPDGMMAWRAVGGPDEDGVRANLHEESEGVWDNEGAEVVAQLGI